MKTTIPTASDQWSHISNNVCFRIWPLRGVQTLWRKEFHEAFYGGYQIKTIPLDTRLGLEWMDSYLASASGPEPDCESLGAWPIAQWIKR